VVHSKINNNFKSHINFKKIKKKNDIHNYSYTYLIFNHLDASFSHYVSNNTVTRVMLELNFYIFLVLLFKSEVTFKIIIRFKINLLLNFNMMIIL
jgi:hypothetical protein